MPERGIGRRFLELRMKKMPSLLKIDRLTSRKRARVARIFPHLEVK